MSDAADHEYMAQALALAQRGLYTTTPNPRVGCVIVQGDAVVGEGWHERAGGAHAEAAALAAAGERARGATMFVTLEPCHHHGRTPPCDAAVIAAGIKRVVIALRDPDPRTSGQGIAALAGAGITVETGALESEAHELNIGFVSRHVRGRPWVRMKVAASLDGKTALLNGSSRWLTGEAARTDGHRWRARACAVLTGIGTVRDDDPQLTVRNVPTSRQPLRIVVDSRLEIAPGARILAGGGALIVCAKEDKATMTQLGRSGAEVIVVPDTTGTAPGKVGLAALLETLGRRGINELHVEAGYKLNGSLIAAGCVDELVVYLAPCLLGDRSRGMADMAALTDLGARHALTIRDVAKIGADIRVIARTIKD